jgi:hypothetical protein
VEATLPTGADSNPDPILGPVSCASAGNCTTVGFYNDTSGNQQAVMLTETSGKWAPGVMAVPPSPATNPLVTINAVSCASAGNCAVVGEYNDTSGNEQGLLLTESSGTWVAAKAKLPTGAAADPWTGFTSVSCASAGNCTAVGYCEDTSGHYQGLLITQS